MITLTEGAVQEVKQLIEKEHKPNLALRIGVKGGGCSGLSYLVGLEEANPKPYDQVFEQDGIKVLVDAKSHLHLDGLTIDYKLNNLMGGGFEFLNPNAKKSCGCGTSFAA